MVREHRFQERHEMRGGTGPVYLYHIEEKEELLGHGRLFAKIVLPPGSSIGVHEHIDETEPYYIIEGEGIFIDADGSRVPVKAGDCCLIDPGQSHGIENNSDRDMVFIALVHNA